MRGRVSGWGGELTDRAHVRTLWEGEIALEWSSSREKFAHLPSIFIYHVFLAYPYPMRGRYHDKVILGDLEHLRLICQSSRPHFIFTVGCWAALFYFFSLSVLHLSGSCYPSLYPLYPYTPDIYINQLNQVGRLHFSPVYEADCPYASRVWKLSLESLSSCWEGPNDIMVKPGTYDQ